MMVTYMYIQLKYKIESIQGLRQDLETGCPKSYKMFGPPNFQGRTIYSDQNHKHVFIHWNNAYFPLKINVWGLILG